MSSSKLIIMKILSSKAHGILDYLFAAFLLLSPVIFHMEGNMCKVTYALGAVHLLLTVLTAFEVGIIKVIPFRIHGLIELFVSAGLAGLAYYAYYRGNIFGFQYFIALAFTVIIVFILTDFKSGANTYSSPGKNIES